MTRGIAAGLSLCAISFQGAASPEHFTIVPAHTVPSYEVSRFALPPLQGRFERVTGSISLDSAARTGAIAIEIDATTVSIGRGWFDDILKGEDFFDVAHHPRVRFRSSRLDFEDERPVRAEGELTLRGATRPLTLELRQFACVRPEPPAHVTCAAQIAGRISRSAFGMTSYSGFIDDEVRLTIQVEAERQASPANSGGERWK